ncbi:MAG: tRNA lysidine(34) synthetase TilS [Sandaracinaceae bacterium]
MLARVRRTLGERGLLLGGERVLVAISGGPDSAALLHVLSRLAPELRLTLYAASVDHGLRASSIDDLAVARRLAEALHVPFAPLAVSVPEGASRQAKAREARYAILQEHARAIGADRIAVGHTVEDQAETVLLRLARGASLIGLRGIAPQRDDGVIRPLIDCRRADVRAHVDRFELPTIEDPSNADPRYARVRVRTRLLPELEREQPSIAVYLASIADEARGVAEWVEREVERLPLALGSASLPRAVWIDAPAPVRRAAIARWLRALTGRRPKTAHLDAALRLRGEGEVLMGEGWVLRIDGDRLVARREPDRAEGRSARARPEGSSHSGNTE